MPAPANIKLYRLAVLHHNFTMFVESIQQS
jgi:hypothetical protein